MLVSVLILLQTFAFINMAPENSSNLYTRTKIKCQGKIFQCVQNSSISQPETQRLLLSHSVSYLWLLQNEPFEVISKANVFLFMYQSSHWQETKKLESVIVAKVSKAMFIYHEFNHRLSDTQSWLRNFFENLLQYNNINSIIILTDATTTDYVLDILATVSTTWIFKWTSLRHTVEWLISTTDPTMENRLRTQNISSSIDFITLMTLANRRISIAQKGRNTELQFKWRSQIMPYGSEPSATETISHSLQEELEVEFLNGTLRTNAFKYLSTQKSTLDGLHLPVSLFLTDAQLQKKMQNSTSPYQSFDVALVKEIASHLGFSYEFVLVEDGGYFGSVLESGQAVGITGQLARRESALSTAFMSLIENRKAVIDYIPLLLIPGRQAMVFYRLPEVKGLDLTYFRIIDEDYLLICLGPVCCVAILGMLIHLLTKSCTLVAPQRLTRKDLRRLGSFFDHICFQTNTIYAGQSGRILRASWGIFCVILSALYSAHLTSTFTVKSSEPYLVSLEDVAARPDLALGIDGRMSAWFTVLETSDNPTLAKLWKRLLDNNATTGTTFKENITFHFQKVLEGGYIFITAFAHEEMNHCLSRSFPSDLRSYPLQGFQVLERSYVTVPTNVFYKDDIYNFLLTMQDSANTDHLVKEFFHKVQTSDIEKLNKNTVIKFSRIELLVYVALGGLGLSMGFLVLEIVFQRCQERTDHSTSKDNNEGHTII